MVNPKRILVVSGTGIDTAALVAERVKAALRERGIAVDSCACHAGDAREEACAFHPDCVISTAALDGSLPYPVFRGLPFLTGIKDEEVLSDLESFLQNRRGRLSLLECETSNPNEHKEPA